MKGSGRGSSRSGAQGSFSASPRTSDSPPAPDGNLTGSGAGDSVPDGGAVPVRGGSFERKESADRKPQSLSVNEPLGVSTVHVPIYGLEQRGKVSYFGIDVVPQGGGIGWRVFHRYNEFHALRIVLGPHAEYSDAPFPRKHPSSFLCVGQTEMLDARRCALELWLRRTLEHPQAKGRWKGALRIFLDDKGAEEVQRGPKLETIFSKDWSKGFGASRAASRAFTKALTADFSEEI